MTAKDMFALADDSPEDWKAEADYGGKPQREGNDQVFVHWPGGAIRDAADEGNVVSERAVLRDLEESTMQRGWWGLPYDICVGQSGRIYLGRGLARSGATSGDVDDDGTHNNDEGEAILCILGTGTKPSDEMIESLKRLLDAHGGDVYAHRDAGGIATACPGDDLAEWIDAYNAGEFDAPVPSEPEAPAPKPTSTTKGRFTVKVERETISREKRSRGQQVKIAQGLLLAHGSSTVGLVDGNGRPDGVFGWGTQRRTEEFQRRKGLEVDGIIGKKTWTALEGD